MCINERCLSVLTSNKIICIYKLLRVTNEFCLMYECVSRSLCIILGNLMERGHFEDLGIDDTILLQELAGKNQSHTFFNTTWAVEEIKQFRRINRHRQPLPSK
jgi:hypothetical protein